MKTIKINNCPITLAEGFSGYSIFGLKLLFGGKKINHILEYNSPKKDDEVKELFNRNRLHVSISGSQEKVSLVLDKHVIRLTKEEERGRYILKLITPGLDNAEDVPANEHLTMQIAKQIYNIDTAANALIFFNDGEPAYITKRFDVTPEGKKLAVEDFAALAGKTNAEGGNNSKLDYSYEELGLLLQKFIPQWMLEVEKFFSLVLFNYIFSNGDAHLKKFSLIETENGEFVLSPAYGLINTRLHINDNDFAFRKGLLADDYKSAAYKKQGHASYLDFMEFAKRIGVNEKRIPNLLDPFREKKQAVLDITGRSFLTEQSKKSFLQSYFEKLNYLNGE